VATGELPDEDAPELPVGTTLPLVDEPTLPLVDDPTLPVDVDGLLPVDVAAHLASATGYNAKLTQQYSAGL